MLFAAGLGTRLRPLTLNKPKPLIEVGGKALIDHALDLADGVGRIVVNLHYLPGQIRSHLAGRQQIVFSDESETILETGGGLKHALPLLAADPVFTLNTDAIWAGPNPLDRLAAAWDPTTMDALLLLIPRERASGHAGAGDFHLGTDGRVTRGPGLIYSGAQILSTGRVAATGDAVFSLNRIWDEMAAGGRLYGTVFDGNWCDVGRPESIALAEAMLGAADV
jgi:MurNAc alpha-1-phosphate uridylyltransferase